MDHISDTAHLNTQNLLNPGGWVIIWSAAAYPSTNITHGRLAQSSFDGMQLLDRGDEVKGNILLSRKAVPDSQSLAPICVVGRDGTEDFGNQVCKSLQGSGFNARYIKWGADLLGDDIIHVIIDNGQNPLLVKPSPQLFQQFVGLVGGNEANILWISAHQDPSAADNPEKGLITGFVRSASAENADLNCIMLDVQVAITGLSFDLLQTIKMILIEAFTASSPRGLLNEKECVYRNGKLLIPRLIPDHDVNNWIARATGKPTVETVAYSTSGQMLNLDLETANINENLYL